MMACSVWLICSHVLVEGGQCVSLRVGRVPVLQVLVKGEHTNMQQRSRLQAGCEGLVGVSTSFCESLKRSPSLF